jgi:hypothetical protein
VELLHGFYRRVSDAATADAAKAKGEPYAVSALALCSNLPLMPVLVADSLVDFRHWLHAFTPF